ncbi:MAG: hypothetical protein F2825_09695 [Actinobacteria bacterium]|uniref:Unannotated protein n=1 Tax=freshwater metagenome TaxID=449393 RepID=A0A6J7IDL2_9ZZZZ|nr:hypothetical protein [Actinomycetota bacterium]
MRFTSPSRRALGLMAVSTIGMSTAVLGVAGIASAAPESAPSSYEVYDDDAPVVFDIPAGVCAIDWELVGADGDDGDGSTDGDVVVTTTKVQAGDSVRLTAGSAAAGGSGAWGTAAEVEIEGDLYLAAAGGDGATQNVNESMAKPSIDPDPASYYADSAVGTDYEDYASASVYASFVDCPYDVVQLNAYAGNGSIDLSFYTTAEAPVEINDPSGYEYRIDGGSWTEFEPEIDSYGGADATVPATNDVAHTVWVRTTSTAGPSAGVSTGPVTPYAPIAAPTNVTVTTTTSRVTISWTAPAGVQVTGYDVGIGYGESGDQGCAITDPSVTTCTFFARAASGVSVGVRGIDAQGRAGLYASQSGITIPGPATPASVPTQDNGDITGPAGPISTLTAGQTITLQGSGYAPNSTVQLLVYSSPVSLGTVVADQNGNFSVEVTVPANLANGTHHLVATGVDAQGNVRNLVITVTVSGGVATLATTGFDAVPVAVGGALVMLVGGGLLVGARRRTNA